MRTQQRLVALLWPVPLGFALGACTAQSATMPEPSYPPPSGYAQGPGGGYPTPEESMVVETAPTMSYAETSPPEPLYEAVPASPSEDHVWVDGSWHWNGYEWVWVGGDWVPEQVGFVYIEPYYDYDDGGYVYQPGHWRRREHIPRGVIVRDHRHGRPVTGHYPPRPRPDGPDYRVPIERGKHPPRPPHASPRPDGPGMPGTPIVRDHRRDPWPGSGRGAPPPRAEPPPRHNGPDQAEPPTVPRRPSPDISSPPAPRAIPAVRPRPGSGAPTPRTNPGFGGIPPRSTPPQSGPPPRSTPGPRIVPRHTPPRGGNGGPPPRGLPPPHSVPGPGAPPPRSAPPPRGTPAQGAPPRSTPATPHVTPRQTPPPRSAPAPQAAPRQRPAPMGAPPRRRP